MPSRSEQANTTATAFERGTRLYCEGCGAEIEIVNPTTCDPPAQVFRCCGEPMRASTGAAVNINTTSGME